MALNQPARLVLQTCHWHAPVIHTQRRQISHLAKSIKLRTCVDLYPKLSQSQPKLFRKGLAAGIDVNVNYVDTWSDKSGEPDKVVVAIHGCPDNYATFTRLVEHFESSRVRVIAPNLPDIGLTRQTGYFWHTTEEKYHFLKDFLGALDIQHIDCLVSHSLGVHTIAALWDRPGNIQINSFGIFAPQPMWEGPFPKVFVKVVDFAFAFPRSQLWANLLQRARLHRYTILPVNFNSIDQFLWLSTVVYDPTAPTDLARRIERLVKSGKPAFMLVSSNEPLVSKRAIAKLNNALGVSPNEIIHVDPTKQNPESVPLPSESSSKAITSYVIEKGTHFPHAKYPEFCIPLVENLLQINHYEFE